MNLTKEQIEALEDFAYNVIPIPIIAAMMEEDELELREAIGEYGSKARRAYYRGYGRMLMETRKGIIRSAQNGSNPAQVELLQFIREFENDMKQ